MSAEQMTPMSVNSTRSRSSRCAATASRLCGAVRRPGLQGDPRAGSSAGDAAPLPGRVNGAYATEITVWQRDREGGARVSSMPRCGLGSRPARRRRVAGHRQQAMERVERIVVHIRRGRGHARHRGPKKTVLTVWIPLLDSTSATSPASSLRRWRADTVRRSPPTCKHDAHYMMLLNDIRLWFHDDAKRPSSRNSVADFSDYF